MDSDQVPTDVLYAGLLDAATRYTTALLDSSAVDDWIGDEALAIASDLVDQGHRDEPTLGPVIDQALDLETDSRRAAFQTRIRYYAIEELVAEIQPEDRPAIIGLTAALRDELHDFEDSPQ